ncbi:MAG: ATP-binding cassette domain-containing protein [Ruminiclostridium sp.]|nr:ATP-binding cassette domain-containing protein [Ruminiclostridium sp.]
MLLETKNLTKNYGKKQAVSDVSIAFEPGINTLLGENGAGKTTLMNMLCTAVPKSSGEILSDGKSISELGAKYREKISVLFQKQPYFPDYTVKEFMYYGGVLKGMKGDEIKKESVEKLTLVNMAEHLREKMKALSGGMRQRVFIAQALMNDPEIIILDEPSAGLDIRERSELKGLLKKLSVNKIIIISTHIVSDVDEITDKLFVMSHGKILAQGQMTELLGEQSLEQYYLSVTDPVS